MKVSELKKLIEEMNPDAEIFLSSDEEGNSYRAANFSYPETMCYQGEWVACNEQDIADGEYEGWEDKMIDAVVVW